MAETLNYLKKNYRTRFCHGGGSKIDVQPGQNVLKLIQDCFESCSSDLTINSPDATLAPTVKNERRTSVQTPESKAGSTGTTNSVKRACDSAESLPTSFLKPVSSRGQSRESPLKPVIHDYVAASKKTESPVSKSKKNRLKDDEVVCQSPVMVLDPEDDLGSVGSPFPVEEAKSSPVVKSRLDDWNVPAAAKSHGQVENLEGPQIGRGKQVVLVQGTEPEPIAACSVQKEKTFSSALLAAVATGTLRQRYSALVSPPSPPPVKDQDIEIENECEFLIDESGDASFTSWISIPSKKKKSKKDGSATPVSKSQPSEKEKTQSKKGKSSKVEVEPLTKQNLNHLRAGVFDYKGTSESDPVSNSEENGLKSQSKKRTHMGKTKKDALRQDSPKQKKNTSWKPEAEELMLSWSGLETEASDKEQHERRVLPSEDLPMPSSGHHQEQTVSSKKTLKSSKKLQSASKATLHSVKKKQVSKQELPKVAKRVAISPRKKLKKSLQKSSSKKPLLERKESSDNESGEEGLEREPVELDDVCTTPLHQKAGTPVIQKTGSEKPRNASHTSESPRGVMDQSAALQQPMDSVKSSRKEWLSAECSGKRPKKIPHRTNKAVCLHPEDTESQTDSDSSSIQDVARKRQKLSDMKIKRNRRKHRRHHGLQHSFAAEKAVISESGPVLESHDIFSSSTKSCEQNDTSSGYSEDLNYNLKNLLSNDIARHKIVMPSNTPNVRRTKRIRLRPLEYWRGERINYAVNPSGELVISGVVHPETESLRKSKQRKDYHKHKSNKTNRREIPASLDHTTADTSKPTIVLDPVTNEEILLECINTEGSHACYFQDEAVEIYKNLNTSVFASGRLILKPYKEKGHQFVHMDTIAFHVIRGKIIATLHKTSYYLTTGDFFYVPAGNEYNIRNLLNEESVLLFTQLKERTKARSMLLDTSSP